MKNDLIRFMKKNVGSQEGQITQKEAAKRAGVHQSWISKIYRGDFETVSNKIILICQNLGYEQAQSKPEESELLLNALRDVWDGTKKQEKALAKLILASGRLMQ